MDNWIEFDDIKYGIIWDRVYEELNFNPCCRGGQSFDEPKPFITYDISEMFEFKTSRDLLYKEYHEKGLLALRECTRTDEYIYALDWHHTCYLFNPWIKFENTNKRFFSNDWPIPLFPNGDYYLFLPKDFRWGILTHPWEKTVCIFGEDLINSFELHKPDMLKKILRSSP